MKVLMFHNRYRQLGGEDLSADQETEVLRSQGVEVVRADVDNELPTRGAISSLGIPPSVSAPIETLRLGWQSSWSRRSYDQARELCERHQPDVVHVQNFWMRLTPSVHAGCHAAGVPVSRRFETTAWSAPMRCCFVMAAPARTVSARSPGAAWCAAVIGTPSRLRRR